MNNKKRGAGWNFNNKAQVKYLSCNSLLKLKFYATF